MLTATGKSRRLLKPRLFLYCGVACFNDPKPANLRHDPFVLSRGVQVATAKADTMFPSTVEPWRDMSVPPNGSPERLQSGAAFRGLGSSAPRPASDLTGCCSSSARVQSRKRLRAAAVRRGRSPVGNCISPRGARRAYLCCFVPSLLERLVASAPVVSSSATQTCNPRRVLPPEPLRAHLS